MAFIPEDGTGLANANSYSSVADADAYFADRSNATWAALDEPKKESALISATDYMDLRYGDRYIGTPLTTTQALGWPRESALGPMPPQLARACNEYAVRAAVAPLIKEDAGTASGYVTRKKTQAGPIVTDVSYGGGGSYVNQFKAIPSADILMAQLCYSLGSGVIR